MRTHTHSLSTFPNLTHCTHLIACLGTHQPISDAPPRLKVRVPKAVFPIITLLDLRPPVYVGRVHLLFGLDYLDEDSH